MKAMCWTYIYLVDKHTKTSPFSRNINACTIQSAPFIVSLSTESVARCPREWRLRDKATVLGDMIKKKKHLWVEVQHATQTLRPLKVSCHNGAHNSNSKNFQTVRFHHYLVEQLGNAGVFRSALQHRNNLPPVYENGSRVKYMMQSRRDNDDVGKWLSKFPK